MANTHSTLTELFTDIADAIREKKNTTEIIIADTFPVEIENLKTSFNYINQDVTAIPDEAFYDCEDIKSVDCYNLISIGTSAFENCTNLKTVILYDNVQNVGENAFKGCSNLTIYCMFDGQPDAWNVNWNPDNCEVVWLGETIETWDISAGENDNVVATLCSNGHMFINGCGEMKNFIYDRGPNEDSTDIPWYSYKSQINTIIISYNIKNIGNYAFYSCNTLTSIVISNSVINIGDSAFEICTSLTSISIPDSVTNIGVHAFFNCTSLTSVTIPDSVTSIRDSAFDGCTSLVSVDYTGTVAQWNAIKFNNYNTEIRYCTIYCINGTIAKDGTITYY